MVQRLTPIKTQMVTQDGECHLTITLELNINVNGDGSVGVQAMAAKEQPKAVVDDKPAFIVPDFTSSPKLNNF